MRPYYQDDAAGITIYHGDARSELPDADAIVTDPPYGTGWYDTDHPVVDVLIPLLQARPRIALFGYPERLVRLCMDAGVGPSEWIVWWPTNGACRGFNLAGARNESEHIAIFGKHRMGDVRIPRASENSRQKVRANYRHADGTAGRGLDSHGEEDTRRVSDVWTDAAPGLAFLSNRRLHPNEKPIELLQRLVEGMAASGEIVLDPFMGSGTTLLAAKNLGRRAIGIEIEERYCEIAARRLDQTVLAL